MRHLIIFILCWLCICSHLAASEKVRIATTEFPPYTSKQLPHHGFINHIVTTAFANSGIQVELEYFPWSRALLEAKAGRFDAVSYSYPVQSRLADFSLSDTLVIDKSVFFKLKTRKLNFEDNFDVLSDLRLGVTRGYSYSPAFDAYLSSSQVPHITVDNDLTNFKLLLLSRIDVFPVEELSGWYLLHNNFPAEQTSLIDIVDKPLAQNTTHLLFPKSIAKSDTLLRKFNLGLAQAKQQGLVDKYKENMIMGAYSTATVTDQDAE